MSRGVNNGELEVSVTQVTRLSGGIKQEVAIKQEETAMAEGDCGELQPDQETPTEAQRDVPLNPAVVSVGKKLTLNIGNYESASISIHLSMPCKPEKDAVNAMFEKVNMWVDRRLEVERDSVRRAKNI